MYTNKYSWTRKDGTYVERHYYVCSRAFHARGVECSYKAGLRKDIIEPDIIDAVRALVKDPLFAEEVKAKIGKEVDTTEIDKEIENYKKSLRQYKKAIETLEHEIDTMPDEEPNRDAKVEKRKIRLRRLEDDAIEVDNQIEDLLRKREAVENNALTLEEVYKVLENFDIMFDTMTEEDKRNTVAYLIKEAEVYKEPQGKTLSRLKSLTFNFPVVYKGSTTEKILWENETHVECVVLMSRVEKNRGYTNY
jgi:site-specific DNA recombinase